MLTDSSREKPEPCQLCNVGRQLCQLGETQRQLCILQNGDGDGEVLEQLLVAWQHKLGLLLQRPSQFGLMQALGYLSWPAAVETGTPPTHSTIRRSSCFCLSSSL